MRFSPVWRQFFDEHIPARVKARYLPARKQSARAARFSEKDAEFFGPSIAALSDLLGEARPQDGPKKFSYLEQARFRSAYHLYWLPLQAAKFGFLFDQHQSAFLRAQSTDTLRVLDLGAGPGTGSLALLMHILGREGGAGYKRIELTWVDRNRQIMEDGQEFLKSWKPPVGAPEIGLRLISCDALEFRPDGQWDLVLAGHLLNEMPQEVKAHAKLATLMAHAPTMGLLALEPAARQCSQALSRFRETTRKTAQIIGPCLHVGTCPLEMGRDWCHTSVPIAVPGNVFEACSDVLGTRREWLKFSYLWLRQNSGEAAIEKPNPKARRVLTEPLDGRPVTEILVCEPDRPRRVKIRKQLATYRGGIIEV